MIKKILNKLNTKYLSLFYKTISISKRASVDYHCEIESKTNIKIGLNSILYKNITIYKKDNAIFKLGKYSHIAPYGYMLLGDNNLMIGDNVAIAPYCSIFCSSNNIPKLNDRLYKDSYINGDVLIGDNILIGTGSVILPNTTIEDNVVVASNSTVKGQLEAGWLYGGNPVRKIKKVYGNG